MLRGYWRYILAVVGLIGLSAAQPVGKDTAEKAAAGESDQRAAQDAEIAALASAMGGELEAADSQANAKEKERDERERRDVQAQEDMAYWAGAMFWTAAAQAFLSLVGIVLIYITFRETRRAANSADDMVKEAAGSTKAALLAVKRADEANEIARATQLAQLRPYVYIEKCQAVFVGKGNSHRTIVAEVRNFGATPALGLLVKAAWCAGPYPLYEPLDIKLAPTSAASDLAPGAHLVLNLPILPVIGDDWAGRIRRDVAALYFKITIAYSDGMGRDYSNQEIRASHGDAFPNGSFHAYAEPKRPKS